MKLSLEELKVESYSTQVCEQELEAIKGGTTPACAVWVGIDIAIAATGTLAGVYSAYCAWKSSVCSQGGPSSGNTFTISDTQGNDYTFTNPDSVKINMSTGEVSVYQNGGN